MQQKTILIGVTSSIAAFKTLELIKLLKNDDIDVHVIMTKHAKKIVSEEDFAKASNNKVFSELFPKDFDYKDILKNRKVDHIALADKADLMIIVPATANTIAKLACGIADDFLTTTALSLTSPIILCPAMNTHMWHNPIVQENITKLTNRGYQFIEPESGLLACGYEGIGKLANIAKIHDEIVARLAQTNSLQGKKIIVTTGGTTEKIDEVRFITNRSSGKMGIAIAEECHLRGAQVLLIRAKQSVKPGYLIKEKVFTTTDELFTLINQNVKDYDVIFHTAAVSDFKVAKPYAGKISSASQTTLKLIPQIKILDQINNINPKIKLIAFKAEYGLAENEMIDVAYQRLKKSKSDAIIANDVSRADRGFEADTNEVYIILPDKSVKKIPLASKKLIAKKIIDYLTIDSDLK